MISMGVNAWLAIVASIAFGFSTNNLILYEAGHNTKLSTIMISPLLLAGAILTFRKKYLIGGLLFAFGFGLNLMSNHPQMTYYLGLVMGIYVIVETVKIIKDKDFAHLAKVTAVLGAGLIIAFLACASKLWTTYEYSKDTMRGTPILASDSGSAKSSSETEGLEWNYAMTWSNGSLDLLSSYIPLAVGGGSREHLSADSETCKFLKARGVNVRKGYDMPTYWGSLPFTSGPVYFGAVIFFLFIFGLLYVDSPVKWWILSAVIFTFLLSLGKNFEVFNKLIFDYLPFYNKFRTPNSVLSITAIIIPLLGFLALDKYLKASEDLAKVQKPLLIATAVTAGTALLLAIVGPSIFDFSSAGDARLVEMSLDPATIRADRADMLRSSAFITAIYILLAAALMYFYKKSKLSVVFVIAGIAALTAIDLFSTGRRYIDADSFVSERKYNGSFEMRPVDKKILNDTDPHYRVHDVSIDPFNDSQSSYYHKTIGGYHAAKLQRIQDVIDRHLSRGNQKVLNMLNAKYFIVPGEDRVVTAQRNPAALGNAWFVNNIKIVNTADEEINALNDFDPAGDAIIHKEYQSYVAGLNPQKSGVINLTEYSPDLLTYESNSDSDQFAVFSEVWYGPDKGWIARIDGKEVDFIRANYIVRAMKIPAGKHTIEFEFRPSAYYTGEIISLIFSGLLLLGFIGLIGYKFMTKMKPTAA